MDLLQVTFVNLLISRKVEGTTWGQTKDSSYKHKGLLLIIMRLGECAFVATAPKLWNSLSINIRDEENFNPHKILLNPFAPEPPATARADPGPFYPLWRHQF